MRGSCRAATVPLCIMIYAAERGGYETNTVKAKQVQRTGRHMSSVAGTRCKSNGGGVSDGQPQRDRGTTHGVCWWERGALWGLRKASTNKKTRKQQIAVVVWAGKAATHMARGEVEGYEQCRNG